MASGSRYIPALDGLRALAVAAVVIYHLDSTILPCGLLGVTLFFVLSGYLITGILIREWHDTKTINLPRFWVHRIRRLFPAIAFVLLTTIVLTAILAPDMLTKLRKDLVAALFWFTNWWYIFQDVSYFDAMGAPSPVNHFWSLAIEEQFYLIWPPVLLLLFKGRLKKRFIQSGIVVLAIASVVLMMVLYDPQADPSRVYYGTDTRAFSLLIGAWLAFVFPTHRVRGKGRTGLTPGQQRIVGYVGIAGLIGIVLCMIFVDTYSPFLYYGGILLVSIFTGAMILSLVLPESLMAKVFSFRPLVYIGKISYGIYIWHYPIIALMTDYNAASATPWYMYLLQIIVVLAVSAFSYHFVENPIRTGCLGRIYAEVADGFTTWAEVARTHAIQIGVTVILVAVSVFACIFVPETTTQQNTALEGSTVIPEGAFDSDVAAPEDDGENDALQMEGFTGEASMSREEMLAVLGTNEALAYLSDETLAQLVATPGDTQMEKAHDTRFLMIGDSVTAALGDTSEGYGGFAEAFPNAILDALKSRPGSAGPAVYDEYAEQGWDGPVVIYELGTNTRLTTETAESMISAVPEGKLIFFINIRSRNDNQDAGNSVLQTAAANHGNVEIMDWYSASENHKEYFDGDGTHLTPTDGHDAYIEMLVYYLKSLYS